MEKRKKKPTSYRISPEARRLVRLLADKLGVSMAAVWELAIREFARKEGVVE